MVVLRRVRRRLLGEDLAPGEILVVGEQGRAQLRAVHGHVQPAGGRRVRRGARLLREGRRRRARLQRGAGRAGFQRRGVPPRGLGSLRGDAYGGARREHGGGPHGGYGRHDRVRRLARVVHAGRGAGRGRGVQAAHPLRGRLHRAPERHAVRLRPRRRRAVGAGRADAGLLRHPPGARARGREHARGDGLQRFGRRRGVLPFARGRLGHGGGAAALLPGGDAGRGERRRAQRPHAGGVVQRAARVQDRAVPARAVVPRESDRRDLLHDRRHVAHADVAPLHGADRRVVHDGRARGRARSGHDPPARLVR